MKHSIGGKINSNQGELANLVEMRNVLTDFSKIRNKNIQIKLDLDFKDRQDAEELLQLFDEQSKNNMNDYFRTQSSALKTLKESWEDLLDTQKLNKLGELTGEDYQKKFEKQANEIVRQTNAWKALGGVVDDDTKEMAKFAETREKLLMEKSGGGYQYTVKNFSDLFDTIRKLEPYLESMAGISKNFLSFNPRNIPIEEFKALEESARKAEEYLADVYARFGSGELREGTRHEVIKQMGVIDRYSEFIGNRERRNVAYPEAYLNAKQYLDIPKYYKEESQYKAGRNIISEAYDKVVDRARKEARKSVEEGREAIVDGYEELLNTKDEVIDIFNQEIDEAKKKISYLKIEGEKKLAMAWGSFEGARPKYTEDGSIAGAYTSKESFTEASSLYESLFAKIEEGAISSDEAIKMMAEDLFKAVSKGEATPFVSDDVIELQNQIEKLKEHVLELQEALDKTKDDVRFWRDASSDSFGLARHLDELKTKLADAEAELEELYRTFGDTLQWRGQFGATGTGDGDNSEVRELQNIIDNLKGEISSLENTMSKQGGEGGEGPGGDFGQCCGTLTSIKTDLEKFTPQSLANAFSIRDIKESLATMCSAVTNINGILAKGNGTLAIQNVTNIGSGEDPALKARYKELYGILDAIVSVEKRQTVKFTNADLAKQIEKELAELYRRRETASQLDMDALPNEQQFQLRQELNSLAETIPVLEQKLKEAQELDVKGVVNKVSEKITIKGLDDILAAIVDKVPEVAKKYRNDVGGFVHDYSLSTIEGLPISDRITRLERIFGWMQQLRAMKVDLGPDLNPLLKKAVKEFPEDFVNPQEKEEPETNFSDMISKILKTLEEIARQVSQIANASGAVDANDVPYLGSKFLSDRNQNLKNLYDRIETKNNGGYANKIANQERIKDFLKQFNTYGNGEWSLEEFARINNISKKNLEILQQYNEELVGQKDIVEQIADKQEEHPQQETLEDLAKEEAHLQEVNEQLEKKNEIIRENNIVQKAEPISVTEENQEEVISNLQEEKELRQELIDLFGQQSEVAKTSVATTNTSVEEKEESSVNDVTKAIKDKTEAFEHERDIVDEVVEKEKKKLKQLKKKVEEVTEAVTKKTEAFNTEGQTVEKTVDRERELQSAPVSAETFASETGGAAILTPQLLGEVSDEASESITHLRDAYSGFSLALREGQGELTTTVEELHEMSNTATQLAQQIPRIPNLPSAPNGGGNNPNPLPNGGGNGGGNNPNPLPNGGGNGGGNNVGPMDINTVLRYLTVLEQFDHLIEKIPQHLRQTLLPFNEVTGQMISIQDAINGWQATRDYIADPLNFSNDSLKSDAMAEVIPTITRYISLIREFMESRQLLADKLSMNKVHDDIQKYLSDNTALTEEQRNSLIHLRDTISNSFDPQGNNISMTKEQLKEILVIFGKIKSGARQFGNEGHSALYKVSQQVAHLNEKWVGQLLSFHDIIRYIRTMATEIKNIDSALIELKKVTDGLTMERLNVSLENSFKTARELGSEVTEVINTTADWARLGYGIEDAESLAKITTLFKNVGDNMTTDTASEYLISTLKGFEMVPEEALTIVDKFNEVANNFAIDTAGIGQALERSAASFNAAHTNLSESIALVTTANAVVQNPESVGKMYAHSYSNI